MYTHITYIAYIMFIVANNKILGIIGDQSNDKKQQGEVFISQIFDENNTRLLQGKRFSAKNAFFA